MTRYERFERLRDNWGQLTAGRLGMFARETGRFSDEVIDEAVSTVLHECEFTPVLKHVIAACVSAEKRLAEKRRTRSTRGFRPGDIGPDGVPTFTPAQARDELRRLKSTNPEWFSRDTPMRLQQPMSPTERREALQLMCSRIYVNGLRRCANLDGRAIIEAEQPHLF